MLGRKSFNFHIAVHPQRESRQELKQGRNPEAATDVDAMKECCLLLMASSVCVLRESRTVSPGMAPPTIDWALPHQLCFRKMPSRLVHSQRLHTHFFFSDDDSCFVIDILYHQMCPNPASTLTSL